MATTISVPPEKFIATVQKIYQNGETIQSIKRVYFNTIKVSGETLRRIDQSRMVVVKFYNKQNELCSLNIPIQTIYKHMPEIIYLTP